MTGHGAHSIGIVLGIAGLGILMHGIHSGTHSGMTAGMAGMEDGIVAGMVGTVAIMVVIGLIMLGVAQVTSVLIQVEAMHVILLEDVATALATM